MYRGRRGLWVGSLVAAVAALSLVGCSGDDKPSSLSEQLAHYTDLNGRTLLDVGGGPGYFRAAFEGAGATYLALDADVGELSGLGEVAPRTVVGSGMRLPFRDGAVDVCYSSNVLEHVPDPWVMVDEMLRVT